MSNQPGSPLVEPEDAKLIAECQQGDTAAFDQLVLRYQNQVFAVALRFLGDVEEAKDAAQDAFVRAYRAIQTFRGEAKFSTWMLAITMNVCRNRRRSWARRRRVIAVSLDEPVETEEGAVAHEVADCAPNPVDCAVGQETHELLVQALQALDEESRTIIVLRDVEGLAYEEIAQVLGVRIGTVKSRLSRARLRLKALLDGRF